MKCYGFNDFVGCLCCFIYICNMYLFCFLDENEIEKMILLFDLFFFVIEILKYCLDYYVYLLYFLDCKCNYDIIFILYM